MAEGGGAKAELLIQAAREYRAFHEALHGLNESDMDEVCLGTWSVKQIVAHMVGWHREMTAALRRLVGGEHPFPPGVSYDDVDAWNARFAAAAEGREVTDLLLDLDRSHEDFMLAADHVPAERYESGRTAYRIVDANSATHYREHAEHIRAWRAGRGV